MSTNPYQSPSEVEEVTGVKNSRRADLRSIAQYQKGIMYCILANIGLFIANFAVSQPTEPGSINVLALGIAMVYLGVAILQLVLIVMLSIKVYSLGIGIVAGILSFVPCVSLLILLIVNQKATRVLQSNGIKVGFFGADMSQL